MAHFDPDRIPEGADIHDRSALPTLGFLSKISDWLKRRKGLVRCELCGEYWLRDTANNNCPNCCVGD